ncbi:MAG: hypothetical protein C4551_08245 [Bacillota bacterium]|nr:MAG: hypothetical protein C4551_08245 [Bacillota bacterium]
MPDRSSRPDRHVARADREDDRPLALSVPAEVEEEPLEVLHQNQLSSDQAHIMPQLFGWLAPDDQRERARYLTDVTRPRRSRPATYPGALAGQAEGVIAGERAEEQENHTTTT